VALLLANPEGRPPDARAIGVAVLAGLRTLAEAKPVVIAVDDRLPDSPFADPPARRGGTRA
jgi:hypothetical protein